MNDAVNFNSPIADDIEYKVGFDDKDPVPGVFELFVSWDPPEKRIGFKVADPLVQLFHESCSVLGTVLCNPVKD